MGDMNAEVGGNNTNCCGAINESGERLVGLFSSYDLVIERRYFHTETLTTDVRNKTQIDDFMMNGT